MTNWPSWRWPKLLDKEKSRHCCCRQTVQWSKPHWLLVRCFVTSPGWRLIVVRSGNWWSLRYPIPTSGEPVERSCPHVSRLPLKAIFCPLTNTESMLAWVLALQCGFPPRCPHGACGLTEASTRAIGRPLISTDGSPCSITPPPELASPTRCTPGTVYPIKILFRTGLIPVVASR